MKSTGPLLQIRVNMAEYLCITLLLLFTHWNRVGFFYEGRNFNSGNYLFTTDTK